MMRIPRTWMYIKYFSRLDRKSNIFHLLVLIPYLLIESLITKKNPYPDIRNFLRQFRAISLPTTQIQNSSGNPKIEILCVAAGKDLDVLPLVLSQAVRTSQNEVTKITVVTRSIDLAPCREILEKSRLSVTWEIIDEDAQISDDLRRDIKENFGKRYGWVLQQFLAVNFILNAESDGVLLVNADTILLRKMTWINENKKQVLMASTEFHPPYYLLLAKLIGSPENPRHTFITHHMLFQPRVFREIIDHWDIGTFHDLTTWVVLNFDKTNQSPLCVEFELYAQGITLIHPEMVELRKFSNTTWKRSPGNLHQVRELIRVGKFPTWNSISFHDYV